MKNELFSIIKEDEINEYYKNESNDNESTIKKYYNEEEIEEILNTYYNEN